MTSLRSFWLTLAGLAAVVWAASLIYAQQQHIPSRVVSAVAPALFLELAFYFSTGFAAVRDRLSLLRPGLLSGLLLVSALLPATLYPALLGTLEAKDTLVLLALAGVVVGWYHLLPRNVYADCGLIAFLIAVTLLKGRFFRDLYPDAGPLRMDFLGQLMWIRLSVFVMLLIRRAEGIGYGFWPTKQEWQIGARQFITALPFVAATGFALGNMRLATPNNIPVAALPLYAVAIFIVIFLVVALSEEFLLRGLILRRLIGLTHSIQVATLLAAIISGLVHLPFRGPWNWKFAILSAVAHWFFGQAFLEAKSIRASMVAHALLVTVWFVAFAKSA